MQFAGAKKNKGKQQLSRDRNQQANQVPAWRGAGSMKTEGGAKLGVNPGKEHSCRWARKWNTKPLPSPCGNKDLVLLPKKWLLTESFQQSWEWQFEIRTWEGKILLAAEGRVEVSRWRLFTAGRWEAGSLGAGCEGEGRWLSTRQKWQLGKSAVELISLQARGRSSFGCLKHVRNIKNWLKSIDRADGGV